MSILDLRRRDRVEPMLELPSPVDLDATSSFDIGGQPKGSPMSKEDTIGMLRAVEREIMPPPRQDPLDYAPPDYRQSDDEIDPVIKGLITHLPAAGSVWPVEDRKLWLELLDGSFRLIFKDKPAKVAAEPPVVVSAEVAAQIEDFSQRGESA